MDQGADDGHAGPTGRKFLVNVGVQPDMFFGRPPTALSAKALIAKIPQVPLFLDQPFEG